MAEEEIPSKLVGKQDFRIDNFFNTSTRCLVKLNEFESFLFNYFKIIAIERSVIGVKNGD